MELAVVEALTEINKSIQSFGIAVVCELFGIVLVLWFRSK